MLNRIIDLTLAYRWLVLVAVLTLLAAGGYALYTIPVTMSPRGSKTTTQTLEAVISNTLPNNTRCSEPDVR
jgi:Cu/Ag efflux pump CusA